MFRYPYQYFGAFELNPSYWRFSNDTLINGNDATQFCYLRAKEPFDPEIIKVLLRDSIHPNGLINKKWLLKVWQEDTIGEEGFDHTVRYPAQLPLTFFITNDNKSKRIKGQQLLLPINGKKRWCAIMNLYANKLELRAITDKGEVFDFVYLCSVNF